MSFVQEVPSMKIQLYGGDRHYFLKYTYTAMSEREMHTINI